MAWVDDNEFRRYIGVKIDGEIGDRDDLILFAQKTIRERDWPTRETAALSLDDGLWKGNLPDLPEGFVWDCYPCQHHLFIRQESELARYNFVVKFEHIYQ